LKKLKRIENHYSNCQCYGCKIFREQKIYFSKLSKFRLKEKELKRKEKKYKKKKKLQYLLEEIKKYSGKWTILNLDKFYQNRKKIIFSGVYAFCSTKSREIFYIGYTKNIIARVISAKHPAIKVLKNKNLEWLIKIRKDKILYEGLTIEARLITRIKPCFNQKGQISSYSGC